MKTAKILGLIDRLHEIPADSELHISEELEGEGYEEIDWPKTRKADGTEIYFNDNSGLCLSGNKWIYVESMN
jgi:hypothetical protein